MAQKRVLGTLSSMAKTKKSKGTRSGGFGGNSGGMQAALLNAQRMREEMMEAQAELAVVEAAGEAGAGRAKVVVNGAGDLLSVWVDPSLTQASNAEEALENAKMIADLVVDAVANATEAMSVITQEKMGRYASMIQSV